MTNLLMTIVLPRDAKTENHEDERRFIFDPVRLELGLRTGVF